MLESGREVSVGGRRDEEEGMLMAGRLGPGEWRRWTRWGTHGPLSRAKTGLAFLPLSLRGLGLFTLFWLGEREKVTGLPSSGGVLASWGLLRSEASIYPREWGTERKGTGVPDGESLRNQCGHAEKTYQGGGNGAGWSGEFQWFWGLKSER